MMDWIKRITCVPHVTVCELWLYGIVGWILGATEDWRVTFGMLVLIVIYSFATGYAQSANRKFVAEELFEYIDDLNSKK